MSRYQYQTVQVARGSNMVHVGAPSHRGQSLGAVAETIIAAGQLAHDWTVRRQANQAVESLRPAIDEMLHAGTPGVLICVATESRERPGGVVERNFRAAFIAGSGRNAREALNEFLYGHRMWETPPPGFTRHETFIWVSAY
jgi:hypothetical protein